jgi:hypothetical protein
MAQLAMQQAMDEITDYLATIDEKLNDVLRAQEDAVWADMIGAGLDIRCASVVKPLTGARTVQGRLSSGIAERALRRRGGQDEERDEQG